MVLVVDAILFSWDQLHLYAFPPFAVIRRVISKLQDSQEMILLIAPICPQNEWFPNLLHLVSNMLCLLPPR